MSSKTSDTFDRISDFICENCSASNGECECFNSNCPFWSEFEDLNQLCLKADSLADDILRMAERYEPEPDPRDFSTSPVMASWF